MSSKILIIVFSVFTSFTAFSQTGAKKVKEVEIVKDTAYWNGETVFILKEGKRPTFEVLNFKGESLLTMTVESYTHASFKNATNPSGTKIYWNFTVASLNKQFDTAPITYGFSTAGDLVKFIMINKLVDVKVVHFVKYTTINPAGVNMAASMYGSRNSAERKTLESK